MHELSLVHSLIESLRGLSAKEGRRILKVNLRAGKMLGIAEDSLKFYFETATKGGKFEGTILNLSVVLPRLKCRSCGVESEIVDWKFSCPACGSEDVELISSREFVIESVELEDNPR